MVVQPYLSFEGRCDEALEFYKKAIDAKVEMLMRFSDAPPDSCPGMDKSMADKVMHSSFRVGDSILMATDGGCTKGGKFEGITLSLSTKTVPEAEKYFKALSEGGTVVIPQGKSFFSPMFGMVKDKFGVHWMVLAM